MEIRVKTLDETRDSHVSVTIRASRGTEEVVEFARRNAELVLYTAAEVAHFQYTEAEMVGRALERRIKELERTLEQQRARIRDLERLLTANAIKEDEWMESAEKLSADLAGERARADQNRAWAERAEAALDRVVNEKRAVLRCLGEAELALRKISMEVAAQESHGHDQLVAWPDGVINNVRDLASPWADKSVAPTSQA